MIEKEYQELQEQNKDNSQQYKHLSPQYSYEKIDPCITSAQLIEKDDWNHTFQDGIRNGLHKQPLRIIIIGKQSLLLYLSLREHSKSLNKDIRYSFTDYVNIEKYRIHVMLESIALADAAILTVTAKLKKFEEWFIECKNIKEMCKYTTLLQNKTIIVGIVDIEQTNFEQVDFKEQVNFIEERIKFVRKYMQSYLLDVCKYESVQFVVLDGEQKKTLSGLIKQINKFSVPKRNPDGKLRMIVSQEMKSYGNSSGRVVSGKIAYQNQTVTVLPYQEELLIQKIRNSHSFQIPYALDGQTISFYHKGMESSKYNKGSIISSNNGQCPETNQFIAEITVTQLFQRKKIVSIGYEGILHIYNIHKVAQITNIKGKKKRFVKCGETGTVVIKVKSSILLDETVPMLSRFLIVDYIGQVIAYGRVQKVLPIQLQ